MDSDNFNILDDDGDMPSSPPAVLMHYASDMWDAAQEVGLEATRYADCQMSGRAYMVEWALAYVQKRPKCITIADVKRLDCSLHIGFRTDDYYRDHRCEYDVRLFIGFPDCWGKNAIEVRVYNQVTGQWETHYQAPDSCITQGD